MVHDTVLMFHENVMRFNKYNKAVIKQSVKKNCTDTNVRFKNGIF